MNVFKAGENLGLKLRNLFPRVVGVSVHRDPSTRGEFQLTVDLNKETQEIPEEIPTAYEGHKIHIRRIGVPILGASPK